MIHRFSSENGTLPVYDKNKRGDMLVALKAALITGFKDKPAVEWDLLYESLTNPSDSQSRIAIRSKSTSSEQKVFEIVDINANEAKIYCYNDWQNDTGVDLIMSAVINKNMSWANFITIYADEKFVSLFVNACYYGFGDIDVFDTAQVQTVLWDCQNSADVDNYHAIAHTLRTDFAGFKTADNAKLVCRAFCANDLGYGARVYRTNSPYYGVCAGGDNETIVTGIETPLRKTELVKLRANSREFLPYGYLPHMLYTDNPHTMHGKVVDVDHKTVKIHKQLAMSNEFLPMMESV